MIYRIIHMIFLITQYFSDYFFFQNLSMNSFKLMFRTKLKLMALVGQEINLYHQITIMTPLTLLKVSTDLFRIHDVEKIQLRQNFLSMY